MKEFIEKWQTDPRFKNKAKLGLYVLFVIFVAIFAFANNSNVSLNGYENEYNENNDEISNEDAFIKVPEEYNYKINVEVNGNIYKFEGSKTKQREIIKKIDDEIINNYIYENNNYYQEVDGVYIITTKEKVYKPIKSSYIEIDTINQYLSKSKKENDKYIIYLKDIILGNINEEYIEVTIDNKIINIDYTRLMEYFNNDTEKYLVSIEIE